MEKENDLDDGKKTITSQSIQRRNIAIFEGRLPHRNGRSLYLEKDELVTLKQNVLLRILSFNNPRLGEVSKIVLYFLFLISVVFRLMIFAAADRTRIWIKFKFLARIGFEIL
jgi:hypothetical protein